MSATVAKFAARKVLGDRINKNKHKKVCGDEDPYFELVETRRGKTKKVKRRIPDYIPAQDAEVLANVRNFAYKMDMCLFSFCGVRFGWGSVVGLVPEIGDILDMLMAIHCYKEIKKVSFEIDSKVLSKMKRNIAMDLFIGLIPFVGDIADAGFKCNTKNAMLLSQVLDDRYARDAKGHELDPQTRKRMSREPLDNDPYFNQGPPPDYQETARPQPARPQPTAAPNEPRSGGGLFGWLSGRERESDVEMAEAPRR